MKVLLTTIVIGQKYLTEYEALFKESQSNYAKKHGYDFKVITEHLDKDTAHVSTISFNKILVCGQPDSANYDYIIVVDADILINPQSPPIHTYMDKDTDKIGIIDEYSQPTPQIRQKIQEIMGWEKTATEYYSLCNLNITTEKVLNTGVLVFQPKKHQPFLQYIYDTHVKNSMVYKMGFLKRGYHYEQACIGYEIQNHNLYKLLPNEFNAIWSLTKIQHQNRYNIEQYFRQNYFIHFAGHTDYDKVPSLYQTNK
jgi:hypothetical protein